MTEQLISKETAVLAKEKGFNIDTINYYTPKGYCTNSEGYQTERLESSNWNDGLGSYPTEAKNVLCSAPTQGLLQKWLREKHNIDILILGTSGFYYIGIHKKDFHNLPKYFYPNFKSYENTLEFGLQEALKSI